MEKNSAILRLHHLLIKKAEEVIEINETERWKILDDPSLKNTGVYYDAYNWEPPKSWKPTYEEVEKFIFDIKNHNTDEVDNFILGYIWVPPGSPAYAGPKWDEEIRHAVDLALEEIQKDV